MKLPEKLTGREWNTVDGTVTSEHLAVVLAAIRSGSSPSMAMGTADRRLDRALKLLKSSGLITHDKATRRWVPLNRNYAA